MFKITHTHPAEKEIADKICPLNETLCLGSHRDPASGQYGAFSVCNATERASWMLNSFYLSRNNDTKACKEAGGTLKHSKSPSVGCRTLLRQAGTDGTGKITQTPLQVQIDMFELDRSKEPMSPMAKFGIGIGASIFLLLLVPALIFWCRRVRRKKAAHPVDDSEKAEGEDESVNAKKESPVELSGNALFEISAKERTELDGNPMAEVDTDGGRFELPTAYNERPELDACAERPEKS